MFRLPHVKESSVNRVGDAYMWIFETGETCNARPGALPELSPDFAQSRARESERKVN